MTRRSLAANVLAFFSMSILAVGLSGCSAKEAVIVDKALPVVTVEDMATQKSSRRRPQGDVEGFTDWLFSCTAQFDYQTVASDDTAGGATCELKITGVRIKLALPITINLPKVASARLKKHEDGHVQICTLAYGRAAKAAYDAAELVLGKTYSGNGANLEEAKAMALRQPEKIIAIEFQEQVGVICDQASVLYDDYCRRDEADPDIDCRALARSAYERIDEIKSTMVK